MDWQSLLHNLGDFLEELNFELGDQPRSRKRIPSSTPLHKWTRPKPMRIRRPKTIRQFSSLLASLGVGNHVDPATAKDKLAEIHAVTIVGVTEDGQQRQYTAVLDPMWENPYVGDNPWEYSDGEPKP